MTVPALEEEWNERFEDDASEVQPDEALCYEMEQNLPAYALYTGSALAFFRKDNSPYLEDEDGTPMCLELESYRHELVEKRLEGMSRTSVSQCGLEGILIPLRAGVRFETVEDVNEYLHNLMFWESLLPPETCGPLMQRIGWLVQKLYTLRGQEDEPKSDSITDCARRFKAAFPPAAVAFPPIVANPVTDYPTVTVVDYPSVAARAVARAAARAAGRVPKYGSFRTDRLKAKRAMRQSIVAKAYVKDAGKEELYQKIIRKLEIRKPGLRNMFGPEAQVKKITVGKGETVFVVIPPEGMQKL